MQWPWTKKEATPLDWTQITIEPKWAIRVELDIILKSGREAAISYYCAHKKYKLTGAKPFLKWYFGRPQSNNFRLTYKTGEKLIRRNEIESYSITCVKLV